MCPSSSRSPRRPVRSSSASTGRYRTDSADSEARTTTRMSGGGARRRRRLVLTEPWKLVRALVILVAVVALVGLGARMWAGRGAGDQAVPASTPGQVLAADAEAPASAESDAGASAGPSPTPAPRVDDQGFAHSDAVGDDTWTVADPVAPSRPGADTVYHYVLRAENGTDVDAAAAASAVESVLNDDRGWRTAEGVSFEQVSDPDSADFVLSIATPPTADALCSPLETASMWNCRSEENVVLNSDRWTYGSPTFSSLDAYHIYVINHEVGHFLGHEHEYCAGAGLKAPTMAQQSRTRDGGCTENGWPTEDNQGP